MFVVRQSCPWVWPLGREGVFTVYPYVQSCRFKAKRNRGLPSAVFMWCLFSYRRQRVPYHATRFLYVCSQNTVFILMFSD